MRLNISIENKSCSELCKHRENTSRCLKVFQNMAVIILLEGMWEWICGGVHIYQSCRPSIALVHLVYFQLFSKTAKNKSVGVKMTKNICKEGLKQLELSK